MPFSCCKKKKKESKESVKSIPIVKSEEESKTFKYLKLWIKDDVVSGSGKNCSYPNIKFTPSTNEGMVKVEWQPDYSEEKPFSETSMDSKLNKTDGLIDVALRWFINYFETSKCSCSSITIHLNQSMTSNPDFIWSHMCFTTPNINCIHALSLYGNGGQEPFVFDFPEPFCYKFPKLEKLEIFSKVKITEACILSLKFAELEFGQETPIPEETLMQFFRNWMNGENALRDFKILKFYSYNIEESIVKNVKKNFYGPILWEDDEKMAEVAKSIFQRREDQDVGKTELIKLIEFDPKKTIQFEQIDLSGRRKKPVTATLCFHWSEGMFVKCGMLDSNININDNIGGRANYEEPS